MTKIYAVTSGDYMQGQDRPEAVFSTRKKAQAFLDRCLNPPKGTVCTHDINIDIQVFEIDKPLPDWTHIAITMTKWGHVIRAEAFQETDMREFDEYIWNADRDKTAMRWVVKTDDYEHAVKFVNAKRAWLVAQGLWGDDERTVEALKNAARFK